MHPEAMAWIATQVRIHGPFADVVEFGSRDINGNVRMLFPLAAYVGIDIAPGPGVDHVGNAADYRTEVRHDCCVCLEVLEHTPEASSIVEAAYDVLRSGGWFFVTAACDPRAPHSGHDGGQVQLGEWYRNVDPDALAGWMSPFKGLHVETHRDRGDIYAKGMKP